MRNVDRCCAAFNAVDNGETASWTERSAEARANFVAHFFAESFPARGPFAFVDVEAVEDVKIFQIGWRSLAMARMRSSSPLDRWGR